MSFPSLVCPYDLSLLKGLSGRTLVVRVDDPALIEEAAAAVQNSGNRLAHLKVDFPQPLDQFPFRPEWAGLPLALYVPALGRFAGLADRLGLMRSIDLRVYLPAGSSENLAALRILSSVGIRTFAEFDANEPPWQDLADLMTYAALGRARHAAIEPFSYIASNYRAQEYTPWGALYFDDPRQFLHLDQGGRVALSQPQREAGEFLPEGILGQDDPWTCPEYARGADPWRKTFLEISACAACSGWRVCLGRLAAWSGKEHACAEVFTEMMEVADLYQSKFPGESEQGDQPYGGQARPGENEASQPC